MSDESDTNFILGELELTRQWLRSEGQIDHCRTITTAKVLLAERDRLHRELDAAKSLLGEWSDGGPKHDEDCNARFNEQYTCKCGKPDLYARTAAFLAGKVDESCPK